MRPLFSEAELRGLLQRGEGQFLEFKSLWDRNGPKRKRLSRRQVRDTIVEYVAAFANADGGTLVLGVDDDGTLVWTRLSRRGDHRLSGSPGETSAATGSCGYPTDGSRRTRGS